MKSFAVLFLLFLSAVAMAGTPVKTLVAIEDIYAPLGFDTNDSTQVIVSGLLPNLCHKSPYTEVKVIKNKIEITVGSLKYDETNPFCRPFEVPFVETIDVGLLDKGNYDIVVNGESIFEKKSKIFVDESISTSVDEFAYAYVNYMVKGDGDRVVELNGYNPSDCFELDDIEVISNKINTYSVLPKMKKVRDFCPMKMVPFTYSVKVPNTIESKKILLHVRAMSGKSVNAVFVNADLKEN